MANIKDMKQEEIEQAAKNSHLLYSEIIKGLENGNLKPTIQAKHHRVYIRKAIPGEEIFVEADNASYTATDEHYLVYNSPTNYYLVNEKGFKRYELDDNMIKRVDGQGHEILGFKPKGAPVLIINADDIKALDLNEAGFTYFPSNWWGSTDTIKTGFVVVLPYDSKLSLAKNIEKYKEAFALFPQPTATKEEIETHLTSGQGFDCYAIDDKHASTYATCDKAGTFKDEKLRAIANQTKSYIGQPDFQREFSQ